MLDEQGKRRVVEIAEQIVTSMVLRGEVDPDDDEALRAATREAVKTAKAAYIAALEFMSG